MLVIIPEHPIIAEDDIIHLFGQNTSFKASSSTGTTTDTLPKTQETVVPIAEQKDSVWCAWNC